METATIERETVNTDYEVRSLDTMCINESQLEHKWYHNIKYLVVGVLFGIVFVKAEIISWFRIQEMFRLQSFHMYGVIGSAVVVGMLSVWLIKKFNIKTIYGEKIQIYPKGFNKGQIYGSLLFGLGWAVTGACPGPLFAQIGTGATVIIITLLSAIAGTWVYGKYRDKLPH
ncbi:MAG: YeeE/YedE thiosulfate transporter family protein [Agriterribacter sp.]